MKTAWEREEVSFMSVEAHARRSDPARMNISICVAFSGWYCVRPCTKYSAEPRWRSLAILDDEGMRFMVAHDTDESGTKELFLAPRESGLFRLQWSASGDGILQQFEDRSGGFEHAIQVIDHDGDGRSLAGECLKSPFLQFLMRRP